MCIAIFSKKGKPLPKKTILKRCFKNNPDGAGYAVFNEETNEWTVTKGMMTWKAFWNSFNKMQFKNEEIVIIHFRVGTSGKLHHPDCTHPFPLSNVDADLMVNEYVANNIVMHNGVVGNGFGDLSDTQLAIKKYATPLVPFLKEDGIMDILHEHLKTGNNRWFLATGGHTHLLGDWVEDKDTGIFYSNNRYLPPVVLPQSKALIPYTGARRGTWGQTWPIKTCIVNCREVAKNFQQTSGDWSWTMWNAAGGTEIEKKDSIELVGKLTMVLADYTCKGGKKGCISFVLKLGTQRCETDMVTLFTDDNNVSTWLTAKDGKPEWLAVGSTVTVVGVMDRKRVLWATAVIAGETMDAKDVNGNVGPPDLTTIFDGENEPLALIDEVGNVVWADEWEEQKTGNDDDTVEEDYDDIKDSYERPAEIEALIVEKGENYEFDCPCCGNLLTLGLVTKQGECPWCWELLIPVEDNIKGADGEQGWTEKDVNDFDCPNCGEQNYIIEAVCEAADSECCRCGAMYLDKTGEIVAWNEHTKADHEKEVNIQTEVK
jgi:hypothetical protein